MKLSLLIKSLLLVFLVTTLFNGCSVNDETKNSNSSGTILDTKSHLMFAKSSEFNWSNKSVVISFEDNFQNFTSIEKLAYSLSDNNLKQGITVKLKVVDFQSKSEKVNEIMIESFDLSKGKNQFTIGYNESKPYIIY